jgi:predicted P-loop ATPase
MTSHSDAEPGADSAEVVSISSAKRAAERALAPDLPPWLEGALYDERLRVMPILRNVTLALRAAPELENAFSFDELARMVMVEAPLPLASGAAPRGFSPLPRPLSDVDVSQVQEWLQAAGLPRIGREVMHQAIALRAQERAFHPVRGYLDALVHDGRPRLGGWLTRYTGAAESPYVQAIGRMFLLMTVARIYEPGCKADYVLVFEGPQGAGKSRACRALGGKWFSDSLPDVTRDKEAAQHLRGKWIIEISELSAIGRAESEALKSFISRPVERYRPPYGREEVIEPRQCVFIGTTNRSTYLGDDTGGRRFWPVWVGHVDVAALTADRDQLFAEAVAEYRRGEKWWPGETFERDHIRGEQEKRFEADAWESEIERFVAARARVQVSEIARDALGIVAAKIGTAEQRRISRVLDKLGWTADRDWRGRFYSSPNATERAQ